MDANATLGRSAFRYAPSIDVFSIAPSDSLLDAINASAREADPAFEATKDDIFAVGHRFIGHGNRDWRTTTEEYDLSASVEGRLSEDLGYDAEISAWRFDGSVRGDTFVDAETIGQEIEAGRYDLTDPLSVEDRPPGSDREEQPARGGGLRREVSGGASRARGRRSGHRRARHGMDGGRRTRRRGGSQPAHVPLKRRAHPRRRRGARVGRH